MELKGLPVSQSVIAVMGLGKLGLQSDRPLPRLQAREVLVRVDCVAVNPHDAKALDMSPSVGSVAGVDFAGVVVACDESVKRSDLRPGTRVCACVHGNNAQRPDNGAFAEYVAVPERLVIRLPEGLALQEAATLALGLSTTGLALFSEWELPLPGRVVADGGVKPTFVLVYGAGTATGTMAVQILGLLGMVPVTANSPRSSARLKALGAEAVFDYRSPSCGLDIREYTADSLAYALDCIGDVNSMKVCYDAIGADGGQYIALNPFPLHLHTRRSIQPDWIFQPTQFGEPIHWDPPFNFLPRPRDREIAEAWYQLAEQLLEEGKVKSHPYREEQGGLAAVIDGVERVRYGRTAGYKLVYSLHSSVK